MNMNFPRSPEEKYKQEMRDYYPGMEVERAKKDSVSPAMQKIMQKIPSERAYRNAGSNFYWIAALSIINSLVAKFGGSFLFVIGLSTTQLVDAIGFFVSRDIPQIKSFVFVINLLLDISICGAIALFGYLTTRGVLWPLITGMILYTLDALVALVFKDWIGFGFHAFFLWLIWTNYSVIRAWRKSNQTPSVPEFPKDIGVS